MKFFIILACVAMASAVGNYRQSYSSYSSGGLSGLGAGSYGAGSYGAGSYGAGYGAGLSGINLGGVSGGGLLRSSQVGYAAQQAVPVTVLVAQPVQVGTSRAAGRAYSGGVIEASVISNRQVQVIDTPSTPVDASAAQVVIPPSVQPVNLEFQSQSSPVTVSANHIPGQAAAPQEYSHQEEADIVRQNIVKPVIHEVNEVITPFRRVNQEVKPVQEEVSQLLATGRREIVQANYGAVRGGAIAQPTVLAIVADGSSSGLLSGASRGISAGYGVSSGYGLSSGLGYSTGIRSAPSAILLAGGAQSLGGVSSYGARSLGGVRSLGAIGGTRSLGYSTRSAVY